MNRPPRIWRAEWMVIQVLWSSPGLAGRQLGVRRRYGPWRVMAVRLVGGWAEGGTCEA